MPSVHQHPKSKSKRITLQEVSFIKYPGREQDAGPFQDSILDVEPKVKPADGPTTAKEHVPQQVDQVDSAQVTVPDAPEQSAKPMVQPEPPLSRVQRLSFYAIAYALALATVLVANQVFHLYR